MRQGEQCVRLAGAAPLAGECGPPVRPMDGQAAAIFIGMALGLALIRRQEIEISSAAMPPVLVYDRRSRRVEEVLLPALPLGGRLPQPYPERTIPLAPGDTLVLISDGLPERRNPFDECLGYRQVEECLAEHGERSAQEILDALVDLGEHWAGGRPPEDDVTVLVVQRRPEDP